MSVVLVLGVALAFIVLRFGRTMFRQFDDLAGMFAIKQERPFFWRLLATPFRLAAWAVGILLLIGLGPIGIPVLALLIIVKARSSWEAWREWWGDSPYTKAGLLQATKRSAMRKAVERTVVTTGLETSRKGKLVRPVVLDVREVARPNGVPYGHSLRIMSATGGGSLKQINDLIGRDVFSDAWTSEVRSHLLDMAGFKDDLKHRRVFAGLVHPGVAWLARHNELPAPKRSKLRVTPEHAAGEGDLLEVFDDPLADHLDYPYPPGWWAWHQASNLHKRPLGAWDDGTEILMNLAERRVLNQGAPGSGKSSWMDVSLAYDIETYDTFTVYIDLKGGQHGWPWATGVNLFLYQYDEIIRFFEHAYRVMQQHANAAVGVYSKKMHGSPTSPFLRLYIDEAHELPEALKEKRDITLFDGTVKRQVSIAEDIVRLSRALGWDSWIASQHATSERFPRGFIISLDTRISCRVSDTAAAQVAMGGARNPAVSPEQIPDTPAYKGVATLSDEGGLARMGKSYFLSTDAERQERSRVAALRTHKAQDVFGFTEALKRPTVVAVSKPQPAPVEDPQVDAEVAAAWDALQLLAVESSGPKRGNLVAEHLLDEVAFHKAIKAAEYKLHPSRNKADPALDRRRARLSEAVTLLRGGGHGLCRTNDKPSRQTPPSVAYSQSPVRSTAWASG